MNRDQHAASNGVCVSHVHAPRVNCVCARRGGSSAASYHEDSNQGHVERLWRENSWYQELQDLAELQHEALVDANAILPTLRHDKQLGTGAALALLAACSLVAGLADGTGNHSQAHGESSHRGLGEDGRHGKRAGTTQAPAATRTAQVSPRPLRHNLGLASVSCA